MVKVIGSRAMLSANTANCALLILAGGASRRMQQDKATLRLKNSISLLEYQISRFKDYFPTIVVSCQHKFALAPNICQIPDIFNDQYLGPVAAIISSIIYLSQKLPDIDSSIIIPVDMPYLDIENLTDLASAAKEISHYDNSPLPLFLKLNSDIINFAKKTVVSMTEGENYSLHRFLAEIGKNKRIIASPPDPALANLNYPEQWEKFYNETTM